MQHGIDRRSLLFSALAGPWRSGPPKQFLAELAPLMKAASIPGAVAGALRRFEVDWIAPLGVRLSGSTDAVTPTTIFQAASLTKQITAFAAHALSNAGKLDFDKPLVSYVDDLPNAQARTVTARHVLSHSSGFPNWRFAEEGKPVPDLTPQFAPGAKFRYSGEGYCYLARVMEEVTGKGLGQLAEELVFEPCGMKSSTLVWDPATESRTAIGHDSKGEPHKNRGRAPRVTREYAAKIGKPVEQLRYADCAAILRENSVPVTPDNMLPNAAASLVTTAEDYARFLMKAMRNPAYTKQQVAINETLGWGPGWGIERAAGHTYLWQWGDNSGYKNIVFAEPSTGNAVFVFTNSDNGARLYDRIVTHVTGHDHPALFWLG